jgi:hypothetical protein
MTARDVEVMRNTSAAAPPYFPRKAELKLAHTTYLGLIPYLS